MMTIVTSKEMASIEKMAYAAGMDEEVFMESAGEGVAFHASDYIELHELPAEVLLLCGKGNNGGDAYVAGSYLLSMEYEVTALQIVPIDQTSPLCKKNHHRFAVEGGIVWDGSEPIEQLFLQHEGLIIDGLFGTGFKGTVQEPFASIIDLANRSGRPILSIDIPSGLNGTNGTVEGEVVLATETCYLGLPKRGFFIGEGWDCLGKLRHVDFGLPKEYTDKAKGDMSMLTADFLRPLLPKVRRSRHKYQAGYVVALAGSKSMAGAGHLCGKAALHSGAGIVRLFYQKGKEPASCCVVPELIHTILEEQEIEPFLHELQRASSVLIGPGIGTDEMVKELLKKLLPEINKPCVIDADALTILAEEKELALPPHTILTPHKGELKRLLGLEHIEEITSELLLQCQRYCEQKKTTLILKGGPTFIFHPGKDIAVCATGDPGMATAGSGDVLTGILAALLAQGMPTQHAAMMGCYLHGLAGEHAAATYTSYCMTASDIIDFLPEAFNFFEL